MEERVEARMKMSGFPLESGTGGSSGKTGANTQKSHKNVLQLFEEAWFQICCRRRLPRRSINKLQEMTEPRGARWTCRRCTCGGGCEPC